METFQLQFALLLLICSQVAVSVNGVTLTRTPTSMFVIGDSYADTGNSNPHTWIPPYGHTWPKKPTGRSSDGLVLTDYIGDIVKLRTPLIPFRDFLSGEDSNNNSSFPGINFSFGGSGVFYTFGPEFPPFATQVDHFKYVVQKTGMTKAQLHTCLAVIIYGGNDYIKYALDHRAVEVLRLTVNVTREIAAIVRTMYDTGIRNFVIPNMQPAGCLPYLTEANDFKSCNVTGNLLSETHNSNLLERLTKIQLAHPNARITIPDHFSIFTTVLSLGDLFGLSRTLEPCCMPYEGHHCGDADKDGKPLYTLCRSPHSAFFWDHIHPTQAGWRLVTAHYPPILVI